LLRFMLLLPEFVISSLPNAAEKIRASTHLRSLQSDLHKRVWLLKCSLPCSSSFIAQARAA
jgi:hypothetical protein